MRSSAHPLRPQVAAPRAIGLMLLAGLLAQPGGLSAQQTDRSGTSTLQGRIFDPDGIAVADAVVVLDSTWQTHSDAQGGFRFDSLPPGPHRLWIRAVGFQPFGSRLELRPGVADAAVKLALAPYTLPDVAVTAGAVTARSPRLERTGYYRRRSEESAARFLETDALLQLDSLNLLRALGRLQSVRLDLSELDPILTSLACRKGFDLWVNGFPVDTNEQLHFLRVLRPAEVEALEIYERNTPPQVFHRYRRYGASRKERSPGCLVAIWER